MGLFRVAPSFFFKAKLSAKLLISKWFFILMQLKLIFTRKINCTFSRFQSESFWNSEKAYMLDSFSVFRVRLGYLSSFLSTSCITSLHFIPDSDEGKWYFSVINFRLYFRRLPIPVFHSPRGVGRGSLSLIWPIRICAMCLWTGYGFQGLES